jgi:hypothetical protein
VLPRWQPLLGAFEEIEDTIVFKGGTVEVYGQPAPAVGNLLFETRLAGGTFTADVTFSDTSYPSACELILFYDPVRRYLVTAGLGSGQAFTVRHFDSNGWQVHAAAGDRENLKAGKAYQVAVTLRGSWVSLAVDGVVVASRNLPFPVPQSQIGIWCLGYHDISVRNIAVAQEKGHAFVVMQFDQPYEDVYAEVIKKVCAEFDLDALPAFETYGPGLIIADIVRDILQSKVVIAEITPPNPNVFYEVGYAHAVNKPTILLAVKGTPLPFDVAGFRILFYENSIGGKTRFEEGLRKHLRSVMRDWYGS